LSITSVDPDSGIPVFLSALGTLLPGIDPSVVVVSSNPAVGTIQRLPARLDQPRSPGPSVDFQPVGLGETEVSAVPPPGFTIPATNSIGQYGRIPFHVTLPTWDIGQQKPLGKDTVRQATLSHSANVSSFPMDVPVTIQSSDPSRLLVSLAVSTEGSPSIAMTLAAGNRSAGQFYIHALDRQGSAQLVMSAPGFQDTYFDIPFTDTLFGIQFAGSPPSTTGRVVLRNGPVKGRVGFGTIGGDGGSWIRPGANVGAHIDSSDPSILAIDTPDVTFAPGGFQAEFDARPVKAGQTVVSVVPGPGFGTLASPNTTGKSRSRASSASSTLSIRIRS
jgi:hypothetical protein